MNKNNNENKVELSKGGTERLTNGNWTEAFFWYVSNYRYPHGFWEKPLYRVIYFAVSKLDFFIIKCFGFGLEVHKG